MDEINKKLEALIERKEEIKKEIRYLELELKEILIEELEENTGLRIGNVVEYKGNGYKQVGVITGIFVGTIRADWKWKKLKKDGGLYKHAEDTPSWLECTKLAETLEEYRKEVLEN